MILRNRQKAFAICLIIKHPTTYKKTNLHIIRRGAVQTEKNKSLLLGSTVKGGYMNKFIENLRREQSLLSAEEINIQPVVVEIPPLSYWTQCEKIVNGSHVLIAGATGSGKSVLINSCIYSLLTNTANDIGLILIDPKRVELVQYKDLPHTMAYACENNDIMDVLHCSINLMETRYKEMARQGLRKSDEEHIYIIIDELADLMTTIKKEIFPVLQRIAQLGRAANIHLICATQCPNRRIIPAELTVNFTDRVALRCATKIESRQIINQPGAELLPLYGEALHCSPGGVERIIVPLTEDAELIERVNFWTDLYNSVR